MVFFFESHHDVSISGSNQSRGSEHVVDCAVGQSDVIEDVVHLLRRNLLTDGRLDEVAKPGGFLNTRSGLYPHMQNELPVIAGWKEILTKPGREEKD